MYIEIIMTTNSEFLGMTKNEQDEILQLFREGGHKVIVATSVAEEGLDIQKCSLVVRYDHVTNEIAMVQSRGMLLLNPCFLSIARIFVMQCWICTSTVF